MYSFNFFNRSYYYFYMWPLLHSFTDDLLASRFIWRRLCFQLQEYKSKELVFLFLVCLKSDIKRWDYFSALWTSKLQNLACWYPNPETFITVTQITASHEKPHTMEDSFGIRNNKKRGCLDGHWLTNSWNKLRCSKSFVMMIQHIRTKLIQISNCFLQNIFISKTVGPTLLNVSMNVWYQRGVLYKIIII